jgi:adenine-specific DNA-methyltransferase
MLLDYKNKKSEEEILLNTKKAKLFADFQVADNNLIYGNNTEVLKTLVEDYKVGVDLVYIDPPFATGGTFKVGVDRANTISSRGKDLMAYDDTLVGSDFLEFLRERLIFLREILSDRGSIYLHIDYKIGHYVKIIMDEVFGVKNFRNDITRVKCNPKNFKRKAYGNIKDLVLFYSKTDEYIWNDVQVPLNDDEMNRLFKKIDSKGRRYTTIPVHAPGETSNGKTGQPWRGKLPPPGRHWRCDPAILDDLDQQGLIEWSKNGVPRKKIFADEKEGKKLQDLWMFKDPQYPVYPTEKNPDLLELIIKNSSVENSIVLDAFCGSGTTLKTASELGRRWIGIDSSAEAIKVTKKKLDKIKVDLFTTNSYNFIEQINEQPKEQKNRARQSVGI